MIRVLLVDDQPIVRSGFRLMMSVEDDLEVVGEAAHGQEAVDVCRSGPVDVVMMDVQMPVMDGIEATSLITSDPSLGCKVLVLTTFEDDDVVSRALAAGASGFLLKNSEPEDVIAGVRLVHSGQALLSPEVTRQVIERSTQQISAQAPATADSIGLETDGVDVLAELTDRERDVFGLLAWGKTNAEIAVELVVSEPTVKTHVSRILTKLALRDRTQAVVFAYQHGLVPPQS